MVFCFLLCSFVIFDIFSILLNISLDLLCFADLAAIRPLPTFALCLDRLGIDVAATSLQRRNLEAAAGRVRAAVLLGEAAGKLEDALAGRVESHSVISLEQAVRAAARLARAGDVVLLAPACASQDQFRDFAERGERFRAAVAALGLGGRGS